MSRRKKRDGRKAKIRHRSWIQRLVLRYGWVLPILAVVVGSSILALTYAFASIPLPRDIRLPSSAEVYDRNGRLIGTYTDEVTRFLIDTDELPKYVGQAVVASEDKDFYDHGGISIRGIIRAGWANLTGGEIQQGGSTITQQYVKQAVLQDPSRTVTRKVKEAILAIKLERRYSKREILSFYLNTVYFGRGTYGIEAAADRYFDRDAEDLTLKQAAFLAGIIPAPERYQPDENPLGARERRDRTLRIMAEEGYIDEERAEKASRGKVKLLGDQESIRRSKAAYFMEWLRKEYLYTDKYYGDSLYSGGLKIYTTLDLEMQSQAETAVANVLNLAEDPQSALVSMTPRGEVRALVGSRTDFTNVTKARGFNYATDPPGRHAGSSFKPFTLITALDEGISPSSSFSGASPATIDEPECYTTDPETGVYGPWHPENFGGSGYGTMSLDQATTNSVNTVYAQLIAEVGAEKVRDMVEEFGFEPKYGAEEIAANCSLALGTLDVTPMEMARAYAGFAGRGRLPEVSPIRYVIDSTGECRVFLPDVDDNDCNTDEEAEYEGEQVVPRNTADVLNEVLTHVVQSGTATVANIGRPVAGKTGTTQDFESAWFAGYTPNLVTVVWEGYPIETIKAEPGSFVDGREVPRSGKIDVKPRMTYCSDTRVCRPVHGYEVTGGGAPVSPAVIWANYMRLATANLEPLPFPEPTDIPDEVINEPAPAGPPAPAPTETKEEEEEPEPTEEPTTEPSPEPTGEPTIDPTGSPGGGGGGGGGGEGEGPPGADEGGSENLSQAIPIFLFVGVAAARFYRRRREVY